MAIAWTIADTRAVDGKLTATVSGVPVDLTREALRLVANTTAQRIRDTLRASATPGAVAVPTLKEAVARGIINAGKVKDLLALQDELDAPTAGVR